MDKDSSETIEPHRSKLLRVLELYAGIGGMHFALKGSGIPFEVIKAFEINTTVLSTYTHNFTEKIVSPRNIESVTPEEINKLQIDIILMSPPCQPFCRTGRKLDIQDTRSSSLAHLLQILPEISFNYLLLENVKGFENSDARDQLVQTMIKCNMNFQEFLLTPTIIGVPNNRLRYYLIAKKNNLKWSFHPSDELLTSLPLWGQANSPYASIVTKHNLHWQENYRKSEVDSLCVGDILEHNIENDLASYLVPLHLIEKYGVAIDIVTSNSRTSNCFTKGYGNFVKGTGSCVAPLQLSFSTDSSNEDVITILKCCKLRYFTPREVSRLLCYPESFSFPPTLSNKQKYKALGNSINVYLVSLLITLLVSE